MNQLKIVAKDIHSLALKMSTPLIYHSLEPILKELRCEKYKNVDAVQKVLEVFESAQKNHETTSPDKKYPLIVLEGLDGAGKSTMCKKLAKKIGAVLYHTPPRSLVNLRQRFDDYRLENNTLRTCFYSLGNYIAALEMMQILSEQPVVLDRFWHSTAAYAIAEDVCNGPNEVIMPEKQTSIYKWPSDLLKPDIVLFLTVSEKVRLQRHSRRTSVTDQEKLLQEDGIFRNNILTAYTNMIDPSVTMVDGDGTISQVLKDLINKVEPLLSNN